MTASRKHRKTNKTSDQLPHATQKADDADDDDIPPLGEAFWSKAQMASPLKKQLISLRLDTDVIEWFKEQGPSYQTRMNQVLRTYMEYSKRKK
jgi:uncharacterized protein (DUF4415 family)